MITVLKKTRPEIDKILVNAGVTGPRITVSCTEFKHKHHNDHAGR